MTGYVYADRGGILVAERPEGAEPIRRELKRLDPDLMLTRDLDPKYRAIVWQVRHRLGSGEEPLVVFEWRDDHGQPLPLSSGLLETFKRQEARGRELYAAIKQRNEKRRETARRSFDEQLDEYAKDMGRAGDEFRSPCFHRGQYLRRSRAKREERGY